MSSSFRIGLSLATATILALLWLGGTIASLTLGPWIGVAGVVTAIVVLTVAFAVSGDLVLQWIYRDPEQPNTKPVARSLR